MSARAAHLAAFIRSVMRGVDYLAAYPARVVAQASDGTLDVVPDNTKVPPLVGVPIRYGVPGVTAKIAVGARVLIEFAAGDPDKPIATVWESASVTELTVKADIVRLADGDMPLARVGDIVVVSPPLLVPFVGSAEYNPANVPHPTAKAYGVIVSGSSKSKSG